MAQVIQRVWKTGPRQVRRTAWGFTAQIGGKQIRKFDATWSKDDAQAAMAARLLDREQPTTTVSASHKTFAQLADEYLAYKRAKGKRTVEEDARQLARLRAAFGGDTPIVEITAQRIAQYDLARSTTKSERRTRPVKAATINRELALLRHILRLGEEWGYVERAPRVRLGKEPEGRVRWLEPDEETRLIEACAASGNRHLVAIVTIALESGMRHGEIMGLTWERIDLSRGVFRLERTKSGRRREVPMRQRVYELLIALPEPRTGRLWPDHNIRSAFERAVAVAQLEDFHFHDLRHHFASWYVMRGGSPYALQTILGHASQAMTRRYAHLSNAHLQAEMEKTASPSSLSTKSAHGVESEPLSPVSARKAGVAQRQSN